SLLITEAGGLVGNFTGDAEFMHQGECVAGNPKIYAQLVGTLARYSKFAGAGDKASVRQAVLGGADDGLQTQAETGGAAAPAAKPTLKARRLKAASPAAPETDDAQVPDAPF
ncbi:MAG: inositol monophosphatase, partial [Polaromonas sp.]|nr:inositol monophosphatase [Polaromonas sp.]